MIKLSKHYNKLQTILDDIEETVEKIEEKQSDIEEKASLACRDLTDREQERYDELDEEISALYDMREYIYSAMESIEEYCDIE